MAMMRDPICPLCVLILHANESEKRKMAINTTIKSKCSHKCDGITLIFKINKLKLKLFRQNPEM